MEFIINSRRHGKHKVLIDDEDWELVSKFSFFIHKVKNNFSYYVRATTGKFPNRKTLLLHRMIMKASPGTIIDHINRNGLYNRKNNLRFATRTENYRNAKVRKHSITGQKGVGMRITKKGIKYYARIKVNKKSFHLGSFSTIKEAAQAYNEAALKYFGDFARLNKL